MFDRQIAYITLYQNEMKSGNAGFIKWETDGKTHKLELHIKGLYHTDTLKVPICTKEGLLLDEMSIYSGIGDARYHITGNTIGKDNIPIECLNNIVINIPGNRTLLASWTNCLIKRNRKEECIENPMKAAEVPIQVADEPVKVEVAPSKVATPPYKPYESKWDQLIHLFETMHPFSDERMFIKLSPADFYILQESCQHLLHNSFLLHGYYNYHYLILGKKGKKEEYYLGVPGVYHTREIMAAQMFGFEGFESTKKECEEGCFGYYCITVAT